MKLFIMALLILLQGYAFGQDPWKNIYSQHAWEARDQWQKPDALIRLLNISSGSKVADIGSHEGYMTFKLANVVQRKGTVYAVDVSSAKLEKVKALALKNSISQVQVVKGEYDNPNLPANTLDAAIILDTYHEIDDHEEVLQHIKTALKRGGRLLICDPVAEERRKLSRADQERKHELGIEYALADLKKAGFKILYEKDPFIDRTKEKGDKMWVVVAVKD